MAKSGVGDESCSHDTLIPSVGSVQVTVRVSARAPTHHNAAASAIDPTAVDLRVLLMFPQNTLILGR